MAAKYRKFLEFIALLLLAIAIVWWFGRSLDWPQVKSSLAASDWRLILIAGFVLLIAYFWRAMRWRAFLAPLTKASLGEIWIATCVGYAAVLTLGRAGEVVRPLVLPMRDRRVRPAASFVTIMIERVYDSITVLLLFAVNLVLFTPASGASEFARARQIGFALVGVLFVFVALLIVFRWRSRQVIEWLDKKIRPDSRVFGRLKHAIINLLQQLATALGVLTSAKELATTIGWSLALWGSVAAGNLIVFRAFGLPFGVSETLFVLGWSMIGSAIPTPGGAAGAFHAVTGGALILLGVPIEQAAAVAIVIHLVDFAPAALFGLFYFLRGDVTLSRLRLLMSATDRAVENKDLSSATGVKAA
jgi:glycosyltransferase 2 family protein